jgi:uncharacterized phage infection (PIP) family protein YhgE
MTQTVLLLQQEMASTRETAAKAEQRVRDAEQRSAEREKQWAQILESKVTELAVQLKRESLRAEALAREVEVLRETNGLAPSMVDGSSADGAELRRQLAELSRQIASAQGPTWRSSGGDGPPLDVAVYEKRIEELTERLQNAPSEEYQERLMTKLLDLTTVFGNLQGELTASKELEAQANSRAQRLEGRVKELQSEVEKLVRQAAAHLAKIASLERDIGKMDRQSAKREDGDTTLGALSKQLAEQQSSQRNTAAALKRSVDDLLSKFDRLERTGLDGRFAELHAMLSATLAATKVRRSDEGLGKPGKEDGAARAAVKAATDHEVEALRHELEEAKARLQELVAVSKDAEEKAKALKSSGAAKEKELTKLKKELKEAKDRVASTTEGLEAVQLEAAEQRSALEAEAANAANAHAKLVGALREELQSAQEQCASEAQESLKLRNLLHEAAEGGSDHQRQVSQLTDEVRQRNEEVSKVKDLCQQLKHKLEDENQRANQLQAQLHHESAALMERIARLDKDKQSSDAKAKKEAEKASALNDTLERERRLREKELAEKDTKLLELSENIAVVQRKFEKLRKEQLQQPKAEDSTALQQVRSELAERSGAYDELKTKHDEALSKLKAEKARKKEEAARAKKLEEQLRQKEDAVRNLEAVVGELASNNGSVQEAQAQLSTLRQQLKDARAAADSVREELALERKRAEDLADVVAQLHEVVARQSDSLAAHEQLAHGGAGGEFGRPPSAAGFQPLSRIDRLRRKLQDMVDGGFVLIFIDDLLPLNASDEERIATKLDCFNVIDRFRGDLKRAFRHGPLLPLRFRLFWCGCKARARALRTHSRPTDVVMSDDQWFAAAHLLPGDVPRWPGQALRGLVKAREYSSAERHVLSAGTTSRGRCSAASGRRSCCRRTSCA